MLREVALVVAWKEIVDSARDTRALISSTVYALMGPFVVGIVSLKPHADGDRVVLASMMSVFTLVAAFVGGMSIAMDTVAGERERRSLLPLLLNPVRRLDVVIGKWLAVNVFALAGLLINLAGVAVMFPHVLMQPQWVLALLPLPLLAASMQVLISTVCRSVKEAQTYLSLAVFVPMGIGMFLVFVPGAAGGWARYAPMAGQQVLLEYMMKGADVGWLQAALLGYFTLMSALIALALSAKQLERDEILYGS